MGFPPDITNKILVSAGIILILVALCATWSTPYGSGDLYISLAAGQDVLAGKLGGPDDWSFSTNGRVWINQNWGADVILYLAESAFGSTGLLAVKFLLLLLSALFLFLALHEQKIKPFISLLITSAIIVSVNMYAVLRPNLFTLPLAALELMLLFKSAKHHSCLWIAVLVILFWANVHAGFIFGVGMLCLWAICCILAELWRKKQEAFRQNWQLLAAIAAAIVLPGLVNPFGLTNLIHPFTMVQGGVWNTTLDWLPIWNKGLPASNMTSIRSFLGLVSMTLILLGLRLAWALVRKKKHDRNKKQPAKQAVCINNQQDVQYLLFESLLALVTLVMAVLSNRFIMLALVGMAPLLARQLEWLRGIFRFYRLFLTAVFGFVLVYGILILYDNVRSYDPHNPVMNNGTGTLFEKMHFTNKLYDKELIRFINANHISGHVYSPWKWEGYLRLNCPQLKPFVGGRAQQIYSTEAYNQYMYTSGYDVPAYRGKALTDVLNATGAHYLIAANSSDSQNLVLTAMNCGNWVIIYADVQWLLFANIREQNAAAIADLMAEDKLIFEKDATQAMSKAACHLSNVDIWQIETLLPIFQEAWEYEPGWLWSYWILYNNMGFNEGFLQKLVRLMEEQLVRLEEMSLENADAGSILQCRIYLSSALAEYAKNRNSQAIAAERQRSLETAGKLDKALYRKWKTITR